jgi:predicted methyltransferase
MRTLPNPIVLAGVAAIAASVGVVALAQAASQPQPAPSTAGVADPALLAAVSGPHRSAANRARDPWRHPAETLAYWGVRPGVTVLEISPGDGWWTEILSPYAARTGGRYIATGNPVEGPGANDAGRAGRRAFEAKFADQALYGKVEIVPFGTQVRGLGTPNSVDLAFTARNIHNWVGQPGRVDAVFADLYAVLKPGGVLGVKEHRANPGQMKPDASDGYVSEDYVIEAARRAGFVLDGRSEINANPRDTKDHPFGVWTLPPMRTSGADGQPANRSFDRARYDAIGESDRMTLRFRKPA